MAGMALPSRLRQVLLGFKIPSGVSLLSPGEYVRLLSAVYTSLFIARLAFSIVVVTFRHYVPASDTIYGLLSATSSFAELLTVLLVGPLVDRFGRKPVLLVGLTVGSAALFGFSLTQRIEDLFLLNFIYGSAAGIVLVTTLATIASYAPPHSRGREMGVYDFVNLFGWLLGFTVGFLLLDLFSGRLEFSFVLSSLVTLLAAAFAQSSIPPESESRRPPTPIRPPLRALSHPPILLLGGLWFVVFSVLGAFVTFLSKIYNTIAFSGGSISLAIVGAAVLFLATQVSFGKLSDRIGREPVMGVGILSYALLCLTLLGAYAFDPAQTPLDLYGRLLSVWPWVLLLMLGSLAFAPAALAALADEAARGSEGSTMSVYPFVVTLGFIVGPPLLGFLSDEAGTGGVVAFAAGAGALLVVLFLVQVRQKLPRLLSRSIA